MCRHANTPRASFGITLLLLCLFQVATGAAADPPLRAALNAIAFSADGTTLIAGLADGEVTIWDAETGARKRTVEAGGGMPVNALAIGRGGLRMTTGGADSVVRRWNPVTGELLQVFSGHQAGVRAVVMNPANWRMVASGGEDTRIILWDVGLKRLVNVLGGHADFVNALAFTTDGKILGSGAQDRRIILWNTTTGQQKLAPLDQGAAVTALAFSPDGRTLASAGDDGSVRLWEVATGLQTGLLRERGGRVSAVAFSSNGKMVVAGGDDGPVFRWDAASGAPLDSLSGTGSPVTGLAFGRRGTRLAIGYRSGLMSVFDAQTGKRLRTIQASTGSVGGASELDTLASSSAGNVADAPGDVNAVPTTAEPPVVVTAQPSSAAAAQAGPPDVANAIVFSPDGSTLASALQSGEISLWNPQSGAERKKLAGHLGLPATGIAYGPDGTLASVGRDSVLRRWRPATGEALQVLTGHEAAARAVATSPDGATVASGGEDTRIALWDTASGRLTNILEGHTGFVDALAFGPDGRLLVSGGEDHLIIVWDAATGRRVRTLRGHDDAVTSLAYTPNGAQLASAARDASVRLWDVGSGRQVRLFGGATRRIRSVTFSPDGATLLGGGDDVALLKWDVASGTLRSRLRGPRQSVTSVVFSRDGTTFASADASGQITLFNAATDQPRLLIRLAARAVARPTASAAASSAALKKSIAPHAPAAGGASPLVGAPILLVTSPTDRFSDYYAEILRAEGLNLFNTLNLASVTAATLAAYDVVVLAPGALTPTQVTMFGNWVAAGGKLVAMRPDKQLAGLLGLADTGAMLTNGYLLVDTSMAPGNGIVSQTMQFHDSADRYTLASATTIATLYMTATTATANPAVTLRSVGGSGGQAAAFTYDLARSVVYSRQGNPAWAAQERDGLSPIRSDDLYFGAASGDPQADWVDLNKVAIPQADEQQRLLANLILTMDSTKKPLPRFWYLPNGKRAAIVMTGDDHGNGGTAGRFDRFKSQSAPGCSVAAWECVRGTSYIYANTPLGNSQAASYDAAGFEVSSHINTNCGDFTPGSLETFYVQQLGAFAAKFTSIPAPATERHHCIVWSDWVSGAKVQSNHGIRLDTSYYYWPPSWNQDRPGMFSGSAMAMHLVDLDGTVLDSYGATTQMTDESGQSYPFTVDSLLDRAIGTEGYFGTYVVNAHTDFNPSAVADAVVASAQARGVPIISARQLLTWLDGRNGSSFSGLAWNNGTLSFTLVAGSGAIGLQALLPTRSADGVLTGLTLGGAAVAFGRQTVKGIDYTVFAAQPGDYMATYAADAVAPVVVSTLPASGATGVDAGTTVTATFSEPMNAATIGAATFQLRDPANALVPATVTYDAASTTAKLKSSALLAYSSTYVARVAGGTAPAVEDLVGNAMAADVSWSFTTSPVPCSPQPCSVWPPSAVPANPSEADPNKVELGMKFKTDVAGVVTGVRFYKGPGNGGTHTGTLWSAAGKKQRTATFTNETSSGWQQVTFGTPVPISANTVYVVSYHTNTGNYAGDNDFFIASGVDNGPLHALQNGVAGGNGVYRYGASAFPNSTYRSSNYWVDVVFKKQ